MTDVGQPLLEFCFVVFLQELGLTRWHLALLVVDPFVFFQARFPISLLILEQDMWKDVLGEVNNRRELLSAGSVELPTDLGTANNPAWVNIPV